MNKPSPLIPQGSNLEQQNKTQSSLRLKIFCALGVNVAVLLVLLMQGCKREQPQAEPETLPVYFDTNPPAVLDPVVDTNPPAPSLVETSTVPTTVTPPPETLTPPALPATQEYVIKPGDTYSSIAPNFGVTPKALEKANPGVDPAKLQIGKKIIIPAPIPPTATTPPAGGPVVEATTGEVIHTVKSGDTLGKLATQYRTTVKAIQAANGLPDTRIKVGQKLKIPKP